MTKVQKLQPNCVLYKKTYTRISNIFHADYLSIARAIQQSEKDIKNGRIYDGLDVLKELRKKYGYR